MAASLGADRVIDHERSDFTPDWYRADLERLFELLAANMIHPRIADRITLDEVPDAHRRIEAGGLTGKIMICP